MLGASGIESAWQGMPDPQTGEWDHKTTHPPITNPMSRFPRFHGSRNSWGVARVPTVVVEVEIGT